MPPKGGNTFLTCGFQQIQGSYGVWGGPPGLILLSCGLHTIAGAVRISPSCITDTTSWPSAVNTSPRARPRAP